MTAWSATHSIARSANLIGESSRGAVQEKLFTYARYNADLGTAGLAELGLGHLDPVRVQKMDRRTV